MEVRWGLAVQRQIGVSGFFLLVVSTLVLAQSETALPQASDIQPSQADLQQILTQMEAMQGANPARYEPYVLIRQYRFYQGSDNNENAKSEVLAQVSFTPPNVKTFDILETRGSGRGTSVVKHILENESELCKDVSRNEISRKNYDFKLLGESSIDGHRAYVLAISPRRDDHALLRGRVFVDAGSFRIVRTEGQPARSPSWWLRSSYIVLRYGEAEGLWLPVATEGSGEVRIFGHFKLASEKVSLRVGTQVAAAKTKSTLPLATTAAPNRNQAATAESNARRQNQRGRSTAAAGAAVIPNP